MKVLEYGGVFTAGGLGYGGLELLWRGRTHWSMLLCGGVCAVLIYLIAGRERTVLWRRWTLPPRLPRWRNCGSSCWAKRAS